MTEVIHCSKLPTAADCVKYISENKLALEGTEPTGVLLSSLAYLYLIKHKGFKELIVHNKVMNIEDSSENNDSFDLSDDDDGDGDNDNVDNYNEFSEQIRLLSGDTASALLDFQKIAPRLSIRLLTSHINPAVAGESSDSSLLAFGIYSNLAGPDAACAGLRDARANWLRSLIASIGTVDSSQNFSPKFESPKTLATLVESISRECDEDMTFVVRITGQRRWRQFAELYQTAVNEASTRIKQQATAFLQSAPTNTTVDQLSEWLGVCLKSHKIQSRDSFLHPYGEYTSVRPKSGSLLKAFTRRRSTSAELSLDSTLATLFQASILQLLETSSFYSDKSPVNVEQTLPIFHRYALTGRWPRAISKGCWKLWNLVGTFIQLFYVDAHRDHHSSQLIENIVDTVKKVFINHRIGEFKAFASQHFSKHEAAAYLVISDLTYLDRHLASIKSAALAFSGESASTLQRVASNIRDSLRNQLDAMYRQLIELQARVLLEAHLYDWRRIPLADGNEGPPSALIAWPLQLLLWRLRMLPILPPQSVSHMLLSVALASFERITARLVNAQKDKPRLLGDMKFTLQMAIEILLCAARIPELIGSSFSRGINEFSANPLESIPNEMIDLCSSFNSLARAIFYEVSGHQKTSPSPTEWISYAIGVEFAEPCDFVSFLSLAQLTNNTRCCHLLAIRLISSPKLQVEFLNLECSVGIADRFTVLFNLLKAMASYGVDSNLLGRFVYSACRRHSQVPELCRHHLIEEIVSTENLVVEIDRYRVLVKAAEYLKSLPCGCQTVANVNETALNNVDSFLRQLPSIIQSLSSSFQLAIGAFTRFAGVNVVYAALQELFDDSSTNGFDVELRKTLEESWKVLLEAQINALTVKRFESLAKLGEQGGDEAWYHRQCDIEEAASLELFSAISSNNSGLKWLLKFEDLLSDIGFDQLAGVLFSTGDVNNSLLPVAQALASNDPLILTNGLLETARKAVYDENLL